MSPAQNKEIDTGIDLDEIIIASRPRVLIIDDEPDTVLLLKQIFKRASFDVAGALNSNEAFTRISSINPSLILLDLMMPGMDGWETIQVLKHITSSPIIIISAIGQSESVVKALKMGADDYITKPFYAEEVIARAANVMRRAGDQKPLDRLAFPSVDLVLDMKTQEAFYHGERIQLTGKMFTVLLLLAKNAPHLVTYEALANEIWGSNSSATHNRLKYLVYLLRQEFQKSGCEHELIVNVDRLGYKLETGN
jgi:DNA-binding response OmpR family regulator